MYELAKQMICDMDDAGFCECLLPMLRNGMRVGEGVSLLYEDWVLSRLRLMRQRSASVFFGSLIGPLRVMFPRQVFPQDLMEAMQHVGTQTRMEEGDVLPDEWAQSIDDVFEHGLPQGVDPGWPCLAPHYRPLKGDVTVVTGWSSQMKSSFMHCLLMNLAKRHGWNFGVFNPEHHPLGSLGTWMVEAYANQRATDMAREERAHAVSWVTDHFHMMRPVAEVPPTLTWLLAVARVQNERYGLDGLLLDPWNLIYHGYDLQKQTETKYVGDALSMLHRFANAQDMHVWVVAHPTKPMHGKASSGPYKDKYPPPTPYDISGGANWYNMPDNCLCCWRDVETDSDLVEIHVHKIRRRWQCGTLGKVQMRFDGRRFSELGMMTNQHWTERGAA